MTKESPTAVSYNTFRTVIKEHYPTTNVGTHSFRKGGAAWLRFTVKAPKDVIQHQGGWVCPETMELCYTNMTEQQRRDTLISGVTSALTRIPLWSDYPP